MPDYSENNININLNISELPAIIEYIKQLKRERDYYEKIVVKYLPIFKVND